MWIGFGYVDGSNRGQHFFFFFQTGSSIPEEEEDEQSSLEQHYFFCWIGRGGQNNILGTEVLFPQKPH